MSDNKLKSAFDRINRLLDERDALMSDVSDIYREVKSNGLVPRVVRKIIQRSRMDPNKRAEEDALQEMYEAALDAPTRQALEMALKGATAREIEKETGIDQATVARSVSLKKSRETKTAAKLDVISPPDAAVLPSAPDHAPETGVIETVLWESSALPPKHAAAVGAVLDAIAAGDDGLDIPPRLDRRATA